MRQHRLLVLMIALLFMVSVPTSTFGDAKADKARQKKMAQLEKLRAEKAKIQAKSAKAAKKKATKVDISVEDIIVRYESYLNKNCQGVTNSRCADMTFSLASAYYKKGKDDYIQGQLAYEKRIEKWQNNPIGREPIAPIPDYSKSLGLYKEAVGTYPKFSKAADGYYQIGSIELLNGNLEESQEAYVTLVTNYPSSYRASAAHFRVAEICFTERDFTCAMDHLNAMNDDHITADIKEMAHFRKSEIYYNRGDFDQAVQWFGAYVEKCDRREFPQRELRGEALEYLAVSFSDMESGADAAIKYFESRGSRAYEDTVIYAVGMKNYDHGQYEQAIKALSRAIEKYPNFIGAPEAQTNIVYSYVIRKKHDKANKGRELLVDNYGKGSSWQVSYARDAVAIAKADAEVKKALSSIAIYFHAAAQSSKEEDKRLEYYRQALRRYVQFIDTYPKEVWQIYEFKYNVAEAYFSLKNYEKAAECYDFVASAKLKAYPKFKDDIDTVGMDQKEIEQKRAEAKKSSPLEISQMEAGFNAIVAMDSLRVTQIKQGSLNDTQSYTLPVTKKFLKYIHAFQGRFPESEYASEILFLAADVQFKGLDYRGTIAECQTIITAYGKKAGVLDTTTFKRASKLMADAYTKNGQYDLAIMNYDTLMVFETPGGGEYNNLIDLASAAIFRKANKFRDSKNYALAEKEFKRISQKYPSSSVAEKGWFESAVTREMENNYALAAGNFAELPARFPKSELRQKSFVRAGENYAKAKMWPQAGEIMLTSAKAFKDEPDYAVGALSKASEYYKTGKDLVKSADMFFLIYQKYPTDSMASTALYNAGLMYEEAEAYERAITTYAALGNKYPTSSFAPSGYFSIGLVYEKMGNTQKMAESFVDYAQKFPDNRSSQLKALVKATEAYGTLGNEPKVEETALQAVAVYDKHKKKSALEPNDGSKAYFTLAEIYRKRFEEISLDGKNQKAVDKQLKAKVTALKPVIEYYTETIKQQVAEWTIKSTYSIGLTYRNYATTVRNQRLFGNEEKRLGTQIQILTGDIQKGYEEAIMKFSQALTFARENGITGGYVDTAELYLMETWYQRGYAYEESGDIIRNSPMPKGFNEEEEMAYLDALEEYYSKYVQDAMPLYENGVQHALNMLVGKNEWTEKIQEHLGMIAAYYGETSEAAEINLDDAKATAIAAMGPIVDPIDQKVGKELEAALASITNVMNADISFEQKLQRLQEKKKQADIRIADEKKKIKELQKKIKK